MESIRINFYALVIAAVNPEVVSQEQAFEYYEKGKLSSGRFPYTEEDSQDMLVMRRQGMKYRDIAEIYGMNFTNVYKRIEKLLKNGGGGTFGEIPPGKAG